MFKWAGGYSSTIKNRAGNAQVQKANSMKRKKSLGLQALENTLGPQNVLTNPKIAGTTATSRNAALAKAMEIHKASQPEPTVSEETPTKSDQGITRMFEVDRTPNKMIGMGGPKIIPTPFNKKNPNPRSVRPVGGPVRF